MNRVFRLSLSALLLGLVCLCSMISAGAAAASAGAQAPPRGPRVIVIELHDTLQPVRADVFVNSLARANRLRAAAVVVDLSSPGGMQESVDRMVAAMRRSQVPIVVVAGPNASRVSGQALRLVAEADVALMGPDGYLTPLWSETPRHFTPEQRHAGSAQLTSSLADSLKQHHRRLDAVDELSGGAHWFHASEAVHMGFVDGIATKQTDIFRFLKDTGYIRNGEKKTLDLSSAHVEPDVTRPQTSVLLAMMNPNLSVLLLTLGLLLIYLEINTPGVVIPGVAGVLLVLLSIYALSRLPLTLHGAAFCVVAILLLALEAKMKRHGWLATVGVVCMVVGLAHLVDGPLPELQVSWGTALGAGLGFGGVTASLLVLGLEARRSKVRTGSDAMLGWLAVAQTPLAPEGHILVRGELWRARLTSKDGAVAAGGHVKVIRADGMLLEVSALPIATMAEQRSQSGA